MLDRFLEADGMFIDTADVYGDGESERTLAPWLARHRDEVVLATKVRFAVSDPGRRRTGPGPNPSRLRREPPPPRRGRDRPLSGARTRPGSPA
jgi:aryl-alcohol dehydrogenase-like predicted oxidoreductase